jgi:hypothetical protein
MSTPLNLGFTRPANCGPHDAIMTAYQNGLDDSGYVQYAWKCEYGCAIEFSDEETRRYSWQFFNRASQINREQRLYSAQDIIEMLKADGLEVVEETNAASSFGDGPVKRIKLRWKVTN